MTGRRRDRLELRTIVVSTRAAYRHVVGARQLQAVKGRADEMLARLEERVRRDGADAEILAEIAVVRSDLSDDP